MASKNMADAASALSLSMATLANGLNPNPPQPVEPAAPIPEGGTPEESAVVPTAPDALPPAGWAPPPTPAPKTFSAESLRDRFSGAVPADPVPSPVPFTEPAPVEAPALPVGVEPGSKQAHAYAELRFTLKQRDQQIKDETAKRTELEAQVKRLAEEKALVAAEVLERDRHVSELTDKVGKLSLSESPEFQEKYDLKRAAISAELSSALVRYAGVDAASASAEASRLLAADQATLADMLNNVNPAVGGLVLTLATKASALDEARKQELSEWRRNAAASSFAEARRSVVETAETRRAMADKALERAVRNRNPVFTDDDPAAREQARSLSDAFQGFAQEATEEQLLAAAAEGFSVPHLCDALAQAREEVRQLKEQISGRSRAGNPPLFASSPYAPPPPPPAPVPGVTKATASVTPVQRVQASLQASLEQLRVPQ